MNKRVLVAIASSAVIIAAMVWVANPDEIAENLRNINPYYLLLVILLYFINIITKAFRWFLLVISSGVRVSFTKTLPFYIIALALNNLTPGKLGGEPVRAYLLKKEERVPIGQGIASIFAEKSMDIIVVTTMALVGAVFIFPLLPHDEARILMALLIAIIICIIIAFGIVSRSTLLKRTVNSSINLAMRVSNKDFMKRLSFLVAGFVDRFRIGMCEILRTRKIAIVCIILTVIIWVNEALRLFIILLALPDVDAVSIAAVLIASSIATIIGIALPGGAGNLLGIGAVFIAVGMEPSTAGAASFLHIATSIWISVLTGVIAMLITGFKVSKMSE